MWSFYSNYVHYGVIYHYNTYFYKVFLKYVWVWVRDCFIQYMSHYVCYGITYHYNTHILFHVCPVMCITLSHIIFLKQNILKIYVGKGPWLFYMMYVPLCALWSYHYYIYFKYILYTQNIKTYVWVWVRDRFIQYMSYSVHYDVICHL